MAYLRIIIALLAWQLCATFTNGAVIPACHAASGLLRQRERHDPSESTACPDRTFDYVIVGGGNAGLTLAARLSEDPATRVAVVEAGYFYEEITGNQSQIPANDALFNSKSLEDSSPLTDWVFETTPQEVCCRLSFCYVFLVLCRG